MVRLGVAALASTSRPLSLLSPAGSPLGDVVLGRTGAGVMGFDGEFLRPLAARGVVISPDGKWVRSPSYTGPNPPGDELLRYFNVTAQRDQYDTNARLKRQWVENLLE